MRWTLFWIIAVAATLWNLFGLYDFIMTLSNNQEHLRNAPPDVLDWIHGLPMWRIVLWGACLAVGVAGSVALLLRRAMATKLFWATVLLMIVAFAYDFGLAGATSLGGFYIGFSCVLIAIEALFALYAGWAARQGMLQRP